MANLNKGEYGQKVYVNMGQDISTATGLTFILQPQSGEKQTKTSNVAVGSTNITDGDESLIANEYLEYTIQSGDLSYSGEWRIKGECLLTSGEKLISNYKYLTVNP